MEPDVDEVYGSYKDLDKFVDSENISDRLRMVNLGYGLDKLKDDTSIQVRMAVAKKGYYNNQFINDSSSSVRRVATRQIKG